VHLTQPEVVADAMRWALNECLGRGQTSEETAIGSEKTEEKTNAAMRNLKPGDLVRSRL
jgi:hypothetical protein